MSPKTLGRNIVQHTFIIGFISLIISIKTLMSESVAIGISQFVIIASSESFIR